MKNSSTFQRLTHDWPVKVLAVAAALFLFWFNRVSNLEERIFSVPIKLITDDGLTPAAQYPRQVRVTMKGDADKIHLILEDDINAVVDLSDRETEGTYKAPIELRKTGTALGIDPLELRTDPLELTIPLEKKVTKYLEVNPVFDGRPTPGYELIQSFVSPTSVSFEGPRTRMGKLTSVNTQAVDLTGKKDDFSLRVKVDSPDPLLRIRGNDTVEVRANMEEAVVVKTYQDIGIITLGLLKDLRVVSPLPDGNLTVQGSQALQESLTPERVRLTVDAGHIRVPGQYTLPVQPDLPDGMVVLGFDPQAVTIRIENYDTQE